jgi:hypothetical protein
MLWQIQRGLITRRGALDPAPAVAASTSWSTDPGPDITLSNGNLTATRSAGFSYGAIKTVGGASSGKKYFEVTITTQPAPSFNLIGIGNASFGAPLGNDANGAGLDTSGSLHINGLQVGAVISTGWFPNDVLGIAIDLTAKKFWVRYLSMSTGTWNNSATADPATGVGGFDISTLAAGPYFIAYSTIGGDVITANFGGSAFTYTAPSGFGTW